MTTETITEFETVEKKVEVSVCDECGKDVGPANDEDTITVPVLANPKIEYDRGEIIRQIKCDLARNSWTGTHHRDGPRGEKVTIKPRDRGYSARDGWVKWDDLSRVIDRKLPPQENAFRAEAEATRELCPGCAADEGFEVDEDGAVSAMTVHTINDSESEPDRDHPITAARESNAYERLEELEDRQFLLGALSLLTALVITGFGLPAPHLPFLTAAVVFWICSFWTYPFHIPEPR